jgi:hypothetical protein
MPYEFPNRDELSDAYKALLATLGNKIGPYVQDYGQLIEKGSPLNNQYQQLKSNISQHIPSNADFLNPQAMSEWAQAAALNAPMGLTLKGVKATKFSKAHDIAQKNAALPIEKGGLGLPLNNTAMDRARAMGFDTKAYHGTNYPEFDKFNTSGADYTKTEGTGAFFTNNPELAGSYTDIDYPGSTPAIYPVLLNKGKSRNINFNGNNWSDLKGKTTDDYARNARDSGKYDSLTMRNVNDAGPSGYDIEADTIAMFEPKNIRSRFAAFDPMKKDSANILATTLMGMLLGSQYNQEEQ